MSNLTSQFYQYKDLEFYHLTQKHVALFKTVEQEKGEKKSICPNKESVTITIFSIAKLAFSIQ